MSIANGVTAVVPSADHTTTTVDQRWLFLPFGNELGVDLAEAFAQDSSLPVELVSRRRPTAAALPENIAWHARFADSLESDESSVSSSAPAEAGGGLRPHRTTAVLTVDISARIERSAEFLQLLHDVCVSRVSQVVVITDCDVHFADTAAAEWEDRLRDVALAAGTPLAILRVNYTLSRRTRVTRWLRRFSGIAPLVSSSFRSSFARLDEVVAAVTRTSEDLESDPGRPRTLLGENRPWNDVLREHCESRVSRTVAAVLTPLSWLGLASVLGGIVRIFSGLKTNQSRLNFHQIQPRSESELLALCHAFNRRHVAVCGYNNGVNHFGWQHQQQTIVPTAGSGRHLTIDDDNNRLTVDAGYLLKECRQRLADCGRQFYVVPNYSYIGMGTIFFVPVHGSGSEVSTLGDTIESVRLWNPRTHEIVNVSRDDALFRDTMYNPGSGLIVLQLTFSIHAERDYFVTRTEYSQPDADTVWNVFSDAETSNIEVRKNRAAADEIQVLKYYTGGESSEERLSVPRDSIGRLWDRLEENRLTAYLFHLLVRKLAYHVELFMTKDEFAIFWQHHQQLPVSKIQLRFVRHDAMPHSPFGDEDRVSADLFMGRGKAAGFQEFVKTHLPDVRFNPGKQSM